MARKAPEVVWTEALELYDHEGTHTQAMERAVSMAYRAGARHALERLRDQVAYRSSEAEGAWKARGTDDPFVFGKLQGYGWAREAAEFLIDEYKEEK